LFECRENDERQLPPIANELFQPLPEIRAAGIEPAWSFDRRILSPLRLPFRHARLKKRASHAKRLNFTPI
jgi:hypothetical protein